MSIVYVYLCLFLCLCLLSICMALNLWPAIVMHSLTICHSMYSTEQYIKNSINRINFRKAAFEKISGSPQNGGLKAL